MAIKIIKDGDRTKVPTYRRTCPECGCEFEYQYSDCVMNNNAGGFVEITCPCCGYPVAHVMGGSSEINNPPLVE